MNYTCTKSFTAHNGNKYVKGQTIDIRKYNDLSHSERQLFSYIPQVKVEGIESEQANEL